MKTDLTQKLKERFFALYWGQEVGLQNEGGGTGFQYHITEATICDIRNDSLILRSISSLTDEEAIEIARLYYTESPHLWTPFFGKSLAEMGGDINAEVVPYLIDYLRSLGVAISFMGISVSEMVEVGWIRIA